MMSLLLLMCQADGAATAERGDDDPKSQNSSSVPPRRDEPLDQRRHSLSSGRAAQHGGGAAGAPASAAASGPGLRKSRSTQSMILRRTGSTATTSRPYDWRTSRSYVSFATPGQLPLSRSGKSLTSVRTRQTIISRKEYHEDLKPAIVAVSLYLSAV